MLAWPEPVLFINPDGLAPDKANKYRTLIYFPYCSVLFSRWWHKNLQLPTCFLSGSNMDVSHTTLNSVTEEGVSWWHFRLKQKQDDLLLSIPYSRTRLYYITLFLFSSLSFYSIRIPEVRNRKLAPVLLFHTRSGDLCQGLTSLLLLQPKLILFLQLARKQSQ